MADEIEVNADMDLVEVIPGIYRDKNVEGVVLVHLGELIANRVLDNTQEQRIALYESTREYYANEGIDVIIIQEEGVPSILDDLTNDETG